MSDVNYLPEAAYAELEKPISAVYSGKRDTCACGCAGKHSSTERSINLIVGKIRRALDADEVEYDNLMVMSGTFVSLQKGGRMYTAYTDGRKS